MSINTPPTNPSDLTPGQKSATISMPGTEVSAPSSAGYEPCSQSLGSQRPRRHLSQEDHHRLVLLDNCASLVGVERPFFYV